jgi:hypothetical protein
VAASAWLPLLLLFGFACPYILQLQRKSFIDRCPPALRHPAFRSWTRSSWGSRRRRSSSARCASMPATCC